MVTFSAPARRRRVRRAATVAAALLASIGVLAGCDPAPVADSSNASARDPRGWFEADHLWYGDLGDPQIVRDGSTYYAYSSPTAGRYLPVLSSTNLEDWRIHPRYSASPTPAVDAAIPAEIRSWPASTVDRWNNNDGLVRPAAWGLTEPRGAWIKKSYWAPGVARIGSTWYAYSAVRLNYSGDDPNGFGRFCITVASSSSPFGPFRDISGSQPILCDVDPSGSIDPEPFQDPRTGQWHLLWKSAGKLGGYPSSIKSRPLGANGLPVPGTQAVKLLETSQTWEGGTIENPSMQYFKGRYYLFYAANSSLPGPLNSSPYATGYAICAGPTGGCHKVRASPLLSSADEVQGPAGGSAFIDAAGRLRFAYSHYWLGEERQPAPRRMRIAHFDTDPIGRLVVRSAG
jgi:beta-xylosidase